jgi:hypothetical protein
MKKFALLLLIACCFCLAGCSKDAEINAFIADLDSTTDEMVKKIDANPGSAGVDEAQKIFDARKTGLKAKWDGIKDVMGMQVSAGVKKNLEDSVIKDRNDLKSVPAKNAMKFAMDKDALTKFEALFKEYQGIIVPAAGAK